MEKLFQKNNLNGYQYISKNGIVYDLLEGKCLGGKASSDLVFIMLSYDNFGYADTKIYSDACDKFGDVNRFVGWFYGAGFANNPEYNFDGVLSRYVNDYEEKYANMLSFIKKQMIKRIYNTVGAYYEANKKVLDEATNEDLINQMNFLGILIMEDQ